MFLLKNEEKGQKRPNFVVPKTTHNQGNYIASLCRRLAEQAEQLDVEFFPIFATAEILYHVDGSLKGIVTGDMGISATGTAKDSYMPGMELHAKYTLFAEGYRGYFGKELWDIEPEKHETGWQAQLR